MKHEGTALNERREKIAEPTKTKAIIDAAMSPVSVALNLWASQRVFADSGQTRQVSFKEVFPGVPIDEDWTIKADPPMPDGKDKNAPQNDRSDTTYGGSAGKYSSRPRWDWTTLSACECVEWCITVCDMEPRFIRSVLFAVHPDAGSFVPQDYPQDPFLALAESILGGVRFSAKREYAKAARSAYGEFRRLMWMALGEPTKRDVAFANQIEAEYKDTRRQVNADEAGNLPTAQASILKDRSKDPSASSGN